MHGHGARQLADATGPRLASAEEAHHVAAILCGSAAARSRACARRRRARAPGPPLPVRDLPVALADRSALVPDLAHQLAAPVLKDRPAQVAAEAKPDLPELAVAVPLDRETAQGHEALRRPRARGPRRSSTAASAAEGKVLPRRSVPRGPPTTGLRRAPRRLGEGRPRQARGSSAPCAPSPSPRQSPGPVDGPRRRSWCPENSRARRAAAPPTRHRDNALRMWGSTRSRAGGPLDTMRPSDST